MFGLGHLNLKVGCCFGKNDGTTAFNQYKAFFFSKERHGFEKYYVTNYCFLDGSITLRHQRFGVVVWTRAA
jgi:hypothetical protein